MTIEITIDQTPIGDVGPCSHVNCRKRATHALVFTIDGIESHTWTCDTHYRALEKLAAA